MSNGLPSETLIRPLTSSISRDGRSDSNSNFFAKQCFDLGIELKKIEVIADDEEEIVEAARRMTKAYDFVVCSGGIGPTHVSPELDLVARIEQRADRQSRMIRTTLPTLPWLKLSASLSP